MIDWTILDTALFLACLGWAGWAMFQWVEEIAAEGKTWWQAFREWAWD